MTDEDRNPIDWLRMVLAFGLFAFMLYQEKEYHIAMYALPGLILWGVRPAELTGLLMGAAQFYREWKSKK